jgi:hypothetical protein
MTGHDGTLASLMQLYRAAGVLDTDTLRTDLARTLDDAEEIIGPGVWDDIHRIGIDRETPAPDPEAHVRLVVAIRGDALMWRTPELS